MTSASSTDWSLPKGPEPRRPQQRSFEHEVKIAASHHLDDHNMRGGCAADMACDKDGVENTVEDASEEERTCSVCNIKYSFEKYPSTMPVFVPRCLHVICTTCCKTKATPNRKCPVEGCGMDCAGELNAFPMHVVIVKRLRDLYTKRTSPSSTEAWEEVMTHSVAQPCTEECDMNQQQQQGAASCKEGEATGPVKHEAKWYCSICNEILLRLLLSERASTIQDDKGSSRCSIGRR